jgi:hypothetical protein
VQVPAWQLSAPLHTLLSRHGVPFSTAVAVQPLAATQLSVVQTFPSLQTSAVPAVQVPFWQVSAPLQRFVSAHEVPFVTGVAVQPVAGLQPSVVHTLPSLQTIAVPAVHTPAWQVSAPLQRFPSGHAVPFATTAFPHTPAVQVSVVQGFESLQSAFTVQELHEGIGAFWQPVTLLQLSVVHAFPSLQLSAEPAAHVPFWHVSAPLQTFASAHGVPFRTAAAVQPKDGLQLSVVHTLPSLQTSAVPAVHVPLWHVSGPLQTFPSEHEVPFSTADVVHPVAGLQPSVVHTLPSLQTSGVPPAHAPPWQDSGPLQTLPSEHAVPLATGVVVQPDVGLQESVVHGFESLQTSGVPAVHAPLWQVSAPLQRFESAHDAPFGRTAFVHTPVTQVSVVHGFESLQSAFTVQEVQPPMGVCWQPVTALHVSVVHASLSLQLSAVPAAQVPLWHASEPLQTLASRHGVPFATGLVVQPKAGLQLSVVHTLPSLQTIGVPAVQLPAWQDSAPLHTLLSRHGVPFRTAVAVQPLAGVQPSVVHAFPSLQTSPVPAVQVPFWQVSAPLQRFESAHDVPFVTGVVVQPVAGLQPSVVHTLPSLQTIGVPAVQTPAWQVSAPLQRFPSGHAVPLGTTALLHTPAAQVSVVHGFESLQSAFTVQELHEGMGACWQPLTELHVSVVHALPSLQLSAVPAAQVPLWQVSAPLHTFASAHGVPLVTGLVVQPKVGLQPSVVHTLPSLQTSAVPAVQVPL